MSKIQIVNLNDWLTKNLNKPYKFASSKHKIPFLIKSFEYDPQYLDYYADSTIIFNSVELNVMIQLFHVNFDDAFHEKYGNDFDDIIDDDCDIVVKIKGSMKGIINGYFYITK